MNLHLPLLADINLHLGVAEEALGEGAYQTARTNLEQAEGSFEELRRMWPDLDKGERGLLAAIIKPLKAKFDDCESRLPQLEVITQGTVVKDDEEDIEPEE
jgi:hypothetical protein